MLPRSVLLAAVIGAAVAVVSASSARGDAPPTADVAVTTSFSHAHSSDTSPIDPSTPVFVHDWISVDNVVKNN